MRHMLNRAMAFVVALAVPAAVLAAGATEAINACCGCCHCCG
ncbi:MAG TPA: hypothetical protein VMQ62_11970 [Dongiaceae bacterium]|nr:hypothetical protein [Dongiaceae bacterium]